MAYISVNKTATVSVRLENSQDVLALFKKIHETVGYPDRDHLQVTFSEPVNVELSFSIT